MRILAIDTATEAYLVALQDDGTIKVHFELCPREYTQRILPMVQEILVAGDLTLTNIDALAFGCDPGSFIGVCAGIGITQGLALDANLPIVDVSTLAAMAQGAWRRSNATRILTVTDARVGEVHWTGYQHDDNGNWHGEETETVLTPGQVHERLLQLSGDWVTAGTGRSA